MQAADTTQPSRSEKPTPLPFRDDTMLGVCAGLGEEFGFNPNYLRVVIGALVLVDIKIAVAAYLGLGLALAFGRLLFPPKRYPAVNSVAAEPAVEANDREAAPETLAA